MRTFIQSVSVLLVSLFALNNVIAAEPREIRWSELKPEDYEVPAVQDPSFYEMNPEAQIQPHLDAPVVEALDGQSIKIPGYIVPLEGDDRRVTEFLLVPYFGACIHVPPPPPNQIIHVEFPEGVPYAVTYDAVWITGTIKVEHRDSDLALVGYQLTADSVESYF
ncbi:DUF3299 domain-containing protein [Aliidiomarina celeris]|uniref:DUF3299 domain-containing protein n=1 Tax=Aliidiomarina celeris TaxID=2249428 RepID=UPI000DEBACC4|nr:DUF3299 domain-containing protein [Aliidiomarina celeris]